MVYQPVVNNARVVEPQSLNLNEKFMYSANSSE